MLSPVKWITPDANFKKVFGRDQKEALLLATNAEQNISYLVDKRSDELLYGTHPYSKCVFGSTQSLQKATIESVSEFYRHVCLGSRPVITLAGDVDEKMRNKVCEMLEDKLSSGGEDTSILMPPIPIKLSEDIEETITATEKEQAIVSIAYLGMASNSPDYVVMKIFQAVCNDMDSVLFKRIRDDNGLAYSVGMKLVAGFQEGSIVFFAGTSPEKATETKELMKSVVMEMAEQGLDEVTFRKAQSKIIHGVKSKQLDMSQMASDFTLTKWYGENPATVLQQEQTVKDVTLVEFNGVIKKYIGAEQKSVTVIGLPKTTKENSNGTQA